jgi:NAD(P)-dependent dehydrogenase (short-subunit alcohol dehydrogenase family)
MKKQKIWFITGISKGFGFEIAKAALKAGDKVAGTVRKNASEIYAMLGNDANLLVVEMDVTKEIEVLEAVQKAIDHFGRLDVVLNNAGYGIVGAIEEVSDAEARKQYDTNVFGLLNVVRAVLPFLRKEKSGHIINVSSLFAFEPLAGWALYGSTKNAVEGISQGLAKELAPLGIQVTAIEPGLFKTGFTGKDSFAVAQNLIADYENTLVGRMRKSTATFHGTQPGDPAKLAEVVVKLGHTEKAPLHLPIGTDAVKNYYSYVESLAKDVNQWKSDSLSTDFISQEKYSGQKNNLELR